MSTRKPASPVVPTSCVGSLVRAIVIPAFGVLVAVGGSAPPARAAEVHETIRAFTTGTFIVETDPSGDCASVTNFDLGYRYVRRIRDGVVKNDSHLLAWTIVHSACDGTVLWEDGDLSERKVPFTPEKVNLTLYGTYGTYTYVFQPTHGMPIKHESFMQLDHGRWRKKHTRYTHWWTDGDTTLDAPQLPLLKGTGGYDAVAKGISGHLYD